jgi:hypothetical protein
MDRVVAFGEVAVDRDEFKADEPEAALLEPGEDAPNE